MGETAIKLIQCPACRRQVSEQATACPGCAQPIGEELLKRNAFDPNRTPFRDGFGFLDYMPMTRRWSKSQKRLLTRMLIVFVVLAGVAMFLEEFVSVARLLR